ncbi:MAG: DUF1684 domain-containing protein [Bryobacteraceae bacterium]|nr:DUF1684 domain-containing protein [Bryobacteraceae bacterium]
MKPIWNAVFLLAMSMLVSAADPLSIKDYTASIEKWRAESEAKLKSDTGWLTVSGLFWLKEGKNTFGSAADNDLVLPKGSPAHAGVFLRTGKRIGVTVNPGASVTLKGKPVTRIEALVNDDQAKEDILVLGDVSLFVIDRGTKIGIRMRNKNSQLRREFTHKTWFPVQPNYRVVAKFIPQPERVIRIPNIVNEMEEHKAIGLTEFVLNGKTYRLEPVLADGQFFYIFKDKTAGKQTYGAGRYLYSELPKDGKVVIDFNKAYNPPCVFTPYATCPLPLKHNQLDIPIPAGELKYGDH